MVFCPLGYHQQKPMNAAAAFASRTLRVYLEDGTPQGLIAIDAGNWTGKILCAPASRVKQLLKRSEAAHGGIYVMIGEDMERPGGKLAYIGEADDVASRMRTHLHRNTMDFERLALVVTVNNSLDKSRSRFLESQLLKRISEAGRARLANQRFPEYQGLSEIDRVDMETFIEQTLLILPLFGFDIFRPLSPDRGLPSQSPSASRDIFVLVTGEASASARETDDGFVVLAGSTARQTTTATLPDTYRSLREQLLTRGALAATPAGSLLFTQNVIFTSPSAAAAIVAGRSASGPREWKHEPSGLLLKDWKADAIEG